MELKPRNIIEYDFKKRFKLLNDKDLTQSRRDDTLVDPKSESGRVP
jgi:hypothetical protein